MKYTDQFTIRLNSVQHDLILQIFSGVAELDLPPALDDAFDSLWENVIEAEHQIIQE
tara:strand:- start:321 stop:491 length:171 start_codon:yes stop_codon:yes gene_type:complete